MTRIEQLEALDRSQLPTTIEGFEQFSGSIVRELISAYRQIEYFQKRLYGRRSEQFTDPRQLPLGLIEAPQQSVPGPEPEQEVVTYQRKKRRGRKFDNLPEIVENRYPEEAELVCSCCGEQKQEIMTDESLQLHYEPCKLCKRKTIKHIFKCANGCEAAPTSPKPEGHIIDNCLATPELLAHVLTSKFVDHLPLHRIGKIFQRYGLEIQDTTLIGWVNQFGAAIAVITS